MQNLKVAILFSIFFILSGCTKQEPLIVCKTKLITKTVYVAKNEIPTHKLKDLKQYPQDGNAYVKDLPNLSSKKQKRLSKQFLKKYFSVWNQHSIGIRKKDALWGMIYKHTTVYGENYRKINSIWFDKMLDLENMSQYNKIREYGITIQNSNLRLFPTYEPLYKDYTKAGEGFPFDYNQNTSIYINVPIFISHYTKDKAWAFVASSFASGWIPTKDIAVVSSKIRQIYQTAKLYKIAIKDNTPIYKNGDFISYIKIGTIFPVKYKKSVVTIRGVKLKGYLSRIDNNKNIVNFPIKFNAKNMANIINELINKPYGWGGYLGNRDCSLLTRDLLATFGFSISRNSSGQAYDGKYISLKDFTNQEKKDFIIKNAIPFLTLIHLKGHIALYIGVNHNEPLILHSTWGVKTFENNTQSRYIVGKSIISSLELGKELRNYDFQHSMLSRIEGIVLLVPNK